MISPIGLAGFCLLSAVSPDNDTPQRASRPFDATRNGFLLGEGAGFLVLEEWEAARRRGARIYAELAGDGNSLSSYRITDSPPDGDGPIQAMRAGARRRRRDDRRRRLHQRARHVDADERPQRERGDPRGVRRRREARGRELDQELDGPPDRRSGRGRGRRLRARDPSRRDAGQRQPARARSRLRSQSRDRRAAPAADPRHAVQFVRLRRLEQLRRAAASRTLSEPAPSEPWAHRASSSPAPAPSAASGRDPAAILDAILAGRSAIAPIGGWDTAGWPTRTRRRSPTSIRATWSTTASCTSSSGAPTCSASTRRAAPSTRRAFVPHRDASRRGRIRGLQRPHRRLRRLRRRHVREPVRLFPADDDGERRPAAFGRELANTVNPMWLLAHAAEQRAVPCRHQARLQGRQRLHHQPQRQRHARSDRGAEALRHGEADRVVAVGHDAPIEPQMMLYYQRRASRARRAAAVRCAPRRQPVRRRRGRAGAGDRRVGRGAGRNGARRGPRRRQRHGRRRPARDPRRRRRRRARDRARARRCADSCGRRRHDRRARQRHAAIGRLRGRAIRTRVRRRRRRP